MMTMMFAGMMTVLACIVTMSRMNLRRWLGYATIVDVCFTLGMLFMFHGTFSGIVAAAFAGLFMSLSLTALVKIMGYERFRVIRVRWISLPEVEWTSYAPQVTIRASLVSRLAKAKTVLHNAYCK